MAYNGVYLSYVDVTSPGFSKLVWSMQNQCLFYLSQFICNKLVLLYLVEFIRHHKGNCQKQPTLFSHLQFSGLLSGLLRFLPYNMGQLKSRLPLHIYPSKNTTFIELQTLFSLRVPVFLIRTEFITLIAFIHIRIPVRHRKLVLQFLFFSILGDCGSTLGSTMDLIKFQH